VNDRLIERALYVIGSVTIVALAGAIWLSAQGKDATMLWPVVSAGVTGILGLLVPRGGDSNEHDHA
jgi:hypothetical protein